MALSQFPPEGQVVLVTGGGRSMGEAAAMAFARTGADAAVSSRKLPEVFNSKTVREN